MGTSVIKKLIVRIFYIGLIFVLLMMIFFLGRGQWRFLLSVAKSWLSLAPTEEQLSLESCPTHSRPELKNFPVDLDDLIIVAHYDDEALAAAGFITKEVWEQKKVGVVVVTFSSGQLSDWRNFYGQKRNFQWLEWKLISQVAMKPEDITEYTLAREKETEKALDILQVPQASRLYLRYPDLKLGELSEDPEQFFCGNFIEPDSGQVEKYRYQDLKQALGEIIQYSQPKRIITHYIDDSNSAHRSIGRLVDQLILENNLSNIEVWNFLVHWNNKDEGLVPEKYNNEITWLTTEPIDIFNVPLGSPSEVAKDRVVHQIDFPGDFVRWKKALISVYQLPNKFDPLFYPYFAKKNEIFWNKGNHQLIEFIYQ